MPNDPETPNGDAAEEFINSHKIDADFTEEELAKNKKFVERFKKIIEENAQPNQESSIAFREVTKNPDQQLVEINHMVNSSDKFDSISYDRMPPNFNTPCFRLSMWRNIKAQVVKTQDGYIPSIFIGGDNRLYYTSHSYYFNESGQGYRQVNFTSVGGDADDVNTLDEQLEAYSSDPKARAEVKKSDIIPKLGTNTYFKIDDEDREKIEFGLFLIEKGRAELVRKDVRV